jgi:hypothetical protein
MKSVFLTLIRAIVRYVSEVAASEAGELLSVRRKWHLLEAERYARLEAEAANTRRTAASSATKTTSNHRCATQRIHTAPGAIRQA